MPKTTLAVKIDSKIVYKLRQYCEEHGIKQGFFVEKALMKQVEREELTEDLLDFKKHKTSEKDALSFEEYLRLRHV